MKAKGREAKLKPKLKEKKANNLARPKVVPDNQLHVHTNMATLLASSQLLKLCDDGVWIALKADGIPISVQCLPLESVGLSEWACHSYIYTCE